MQTLIYNTKSEFQLLRLLRLHFFDCFEKEGSKIIAIPTIPNIHQRILEAVSKPNSFDMSNWHTCETTHCRAGWVTTLAGDAGKALEAKTSTCFAAMQIYKASSPIPVSPVRFYEDTKTALADIQRCAAEESNKQLAIKLVRDLVDASIAHYRTSDAGDVKYLWQQKKYEAREAEACEMVLNAMVGEQEWTEQEINDALGL